VDPDLANLGEAEATMQYNLQDPKLPDDQNHAYIYKEAHSLHTNVDYPGEIFLQHDYTGNTFDEATPWYSPSDSAVYLEVGSEGTRQFKVTFSTFGYEAICTVAGPEVGHMREWEVNMEGIERGEFYFNDNLASPTNIGIGGWGLPLCLGKSMDSPTGPIEPSSSEENPYKGMGIDNTLLMPPRECIPINCINHRNIFDPNNKDFSVGRERPDEFGLVQNFYDNNTRTKCTESEYAVRSNLIVHLHTTYTSRLCSFASEPALHNSLHIFVALLKKYLRYASAQLVDLSLTPPAQTRDSLLNQMVLTTQKTESARLPKFARPQSTPALLRMLPPTVNVRHVMGAPLLKLVRLVLVLMSALLEPARLGTPHLSLVVVAKPPTLSPWQSTHPSFPLPTPRLS